MFKFVHAADLHLDSPLRGLDQYEGAPVEAIRGATRRALENLVQLAIDRQVQFVVLSGDIYDGDWKCYQTGLFFANLMRRLANEKIPVVMISGNHDAENKMTKSLRLPENVQVLSHKSAETATHPRLDEIGVAVHGRSYSKAAEIDSLLPTYPLPSRGRFNIGLLHTSLTGAEGHHRYAPCTVQDLLEKEYDYWALGHVHTRNEVQLDPPIIFPGNIQGRNIRELGAKGCYVVTVDDRRHCELEFVPLDVVRFVRCLITLKKNHQVDDLLELANRSLEQVFQEHCRMPLAVRMEIQGATASHSQLSTRRNAVIAELRNLASEVGNEAIWLEQIQFRTQSIRDTLLDQDGPIAEIVRQATQARTDSRTAVEFASVLEELVAKLPAEFMDGPDAIRLSETTWLENQLLDAQALLMARLEEQADS